MNLDGARVWLTGASSGIGAALVAPLTRAGARVAVSARRAAALEDVCAKAGAGPEAVLVVPVDVTDRDAVHRAAQGIERAWGGIDLAIFNAGIHGRISVSSFDAGVFASVIATNFLGVIYGIEAVLPDMLRRSSGHIAATASLAGYRALPGMPAYGASKAALILALEALRFDLAPRGIGVTVISPGFVRTPMTNRRNWMPAAVEADVAADAIVRGLRRGKKEIHFPARLSWAMKTLRVLPYPLYERLVAFAAGGTNSGR